MSLRTHTLVGQVGNLLTDCQSVPASGVLSRSWGRQSLPHGRGSATICKHAAFQTEPRPSGSDSSNEPRTPKKRLGNPASKARPLTARPEAAQ
jgi:hypothetical protein